MEQKEISLKELFQVIWKGKWIIMAAAGLGLIIAGVGGMIYDTGSSSVTTIVTMQWNGISQGEYPDGSRFDYADAIEPYVVTNSIDNLDMGLNTNDVINQLEMHPIIPGNAAALIQTALQNGETLTYYATDYKIDLNNGELGITVEEGQDLLNEIISEFRLDFDRKFIQQTIILDYTDVDYTDIDYIDIYYILNAQTTSIKQVMASKMELNPDFRSSTLGIGFNEILVQVDLLEQIELDQIQSRTNTYLLSKDVDYLITKYNYDIEVKTFEKETLELQETDTAFLVSSYEGTKQTVIIPGMTDQQEIQLDTYYQELVKDLVEIQASIAELEKDIEYLELQVLRLQGNDPEYSVTIQQQQDNELKVNTAIDSADEKLELIIEDANKLLIEYNEYVTNNVIKPLMSPQYESSVSVLMISAVGMVVSAGLGTIVVLFKHEW